MREKAGHSNSGYVCFKRSTLVFVMVMIMCIGYILWTEFSTTNRAVFSEKFSTAFNNGLEALKEKKSTRIITTSILTTKKASTRTSTITTTSLPLWDMGSVPTKENLDTVSILGRRIRIRRQDASNLNVRVHPRMFDLNKRKYRMIYDNGKSRNISVILKNIDIEFDYHDIGRRIEIHWPNYDKWYPAIIMQVFNSTYPLQHLVKYTDEKTFENLTLIEESTREAPSIELIGCDIVSTMIS
eukprot:m.148409 g.148409  ORF g.148409 m.148409 type:complete len:241 (-) comp14997_c1_seq9:436-1158(-)